MCMFVVCMCEYVYMRGVYVCNVYVWCVMCVYVCVVYMHACGVNVCVYCVSGVSMCM